MQKYQAVIFDLDGTIIDTESIWKSVTIELVESYGVLLGDADRDYLESVIHGVSLREACERVVDFCKLKRPLSEVIEQKKAMALKRYRTDLSFIDGFIEFHKQISHYKLKSTIATNSDDQSLSIARERLQLDDFFGEHVYGISAVNNSSKPSPDIFLYAAKQINCMPSECIVIEDSALGIKAAKSAGMYCIGINTSNDRTQLLEADEIVETYTELMGRFE